MCIGFPEIRGRRAANSCLRKVRLRYLAVAEQEEQIAHILGISDSGCDESRRNLLRIESERTQPKLND